MILVASRKANLGEGIQHVLDGIELLWKNEVSIWDVFLNSAVNLDVQVWWWPGLRALLHS